MAVPSRLRSDLKFQQSPELPIAPLIGGASVLCRLTWKVVPYLGGEVRVLAALTPEQPGQPTPRGGHGVGTSCWVFWDTLEDPSVPRA